MYMELQFTAADILKFGTPNLYLHSSQSTNDATGSAWISSRRDSRGRHVYAFGCEPGTPLTYINANLDGYDTLNEPIDIDKVFSDLSTNQYLFVVDEGDGLLFVATNAEEVDLHPTLG